MSPLVLNPAAADGPHCAAALLQPAVLPLCDAVVSVAGSTYPAHRAVLAIHSAQLAHRLLVAQPPQHTPLSGNGASGGLADADTGNGGGATAATATATAVAVAPAPAPAEPVVLSLAVPGVPEQRVRAGWQLVYDYLYEVYLPDVDVAVAAAALEVCDHWEFDDLGATLLDFVLDQITPANCVELYVTGSREAGHRIGPRVTAVRDACALLMKERFDQVENWGKLDHRSFCRVLKLNDLNVEGNEQAVFWAVASWIRAQELELARSSLRSAESPEGASAASTPLPDLLVSPADVESLIKLVRFPTIPKLVATGFHESPIVTRYPVVEKYMAQAGRAPRRHVTIETSPLFRPRRVGVLTFSDRVSSFSRVSARMQTSARYFAGCLWNLVVGKRDGFVELYLGALAEDSGGALLVQLDVTLYIAQAVPGAPSDELPAMIRRELKGVTFAHSGQKTGFPRMLPLEEVADFAPNNALSVGATLRLRGCHDQVDTIDTLVDHTAESITM